MEKEQIHYAIKKFDFTYILLRKISSFNFTKLKLIDVTILLSDGYIIKMTGDILPLIHRVKFTMKNEFLPLIGRILPPRGKNSFFIRQNQQNFDFLFWRFKFLWVYLQKLSKNLRFNYFKSRLHDKVRHVLLLQPKQYFKNVCKKKNIYKKYKKVKVLTFRFKKHLTLLLNNWMGLLKLKNNFTEWWLKFKKLKHHSVKLFFNFVKSKWFNKLNIIFFINLFFKTNWKNIQYRYLIRKMLKNLGIRKVANKFLQRIILKKICYNRSRFFLTNWFEIIIFCLNFSWIPIVFKKTKIIKKKLMLNNKFIKSITSFEHKFYKIYAQNQQDRFVKKFFTKLRMFNSNALKKMIHLEKNANKIDKLSILFKYFDNIDDELIRLFVKKQILVLWNSYLRIYFPSDDVMSSIKFLKIFNFFLKTLNIFKDLEIDLKLEKKKKFLKSELFSKLSKSRNIINVHKIYSVSNVQLDEALNSSESGKKILKKKYIKKKYIKKKYIKKLVKVCLVENNELRRKWYFNAIFWKFFFKPFYFWLIFPCNFFFYYYLKMLFNLWLRSFLNLKNF